MNASMGMQWSEYNIAGCLRVGCHNPLIGGCLPKSWSRFVALVAGNKPELPKLGLKHLPNFVYRLFQETGEISSKTCRERQSASTYGTLE